MAQTTLFAVADQTSAFLALKLSTIIWTFWLGLLYGGFFMVWLYRFGTHASMWAKSRCPLCGAAIDTIYEIPVFSWLCLGGKCHNCKAPVSWQYPFGEACCSLLFGLPALFLVWPTQNLAEMNAAYEKVFAFGFIGLIVWSSVLFRSRKVKTPWSFRLFVLIWLALGAFAASGLYLFINTALPTKDPFANFVLLTAFYSCLTITCATIVRDWILGIHHFTQRTTSPRLEEAVPGAKAENKPEETK